MKSLDRAAVFGFSAARDCQQPNVREVLLPVVAPSVPERSL